MPNSCRAIPRRITAAGCCCTNWTGSSDAAEALQQACRADASFYDGWMALALVYEAQQRWQEAGEAILHMKELRPEAEDWKGLVFRIRQQMEAQEEAGAANAPHSESLSPDQRTPPPDNPGSSAPGTE